MSQVESNPNISMTGSDVGYVSSLGYKREGNVKYYYFHISFKAF
jgi:hypothetical protein